MPDDHKGGGQEHGQPSDCPLSVLPLTAGSLIGNPKGAFPVNPMLQFPDDQCLLPISQAPRRGDVEDNSDAGLHFIYILTPRSTCAREFKMQLRIRNADFVIDRNHQQNSLYRGMVTMDRSIWRIRAFCVR